MEAELSRKALEGSLQSTIRVTFGAYIRCMICEGSRTMPSKGCVGVWVATLLHINSIVWCFQSLHKSVILSQRADSKPLTLPNKLK